MRGATLARRYARAFLLLARGEEGRLSRLENELTTFAELFGTSRDLRVALENPGFPKAVREELVKKMGESFGFDSDFQNFLLLLIREGRIALLPKVSEIFCSLVDEVCGRLHADIVSARPLSREQEESLRSALSKIFADQEILLNIRTDEDLISGFRVRVGSRVFEGSVRNALESLRHELHR